MSQFQLFDELPSDEYAALKADIARRGVLVPIEYDEAGNLLDGHHRKRACDALGLKDYPTVVRRFASDDEKEEHVVTLNVRRRHLTNEQKRKWAGWYLKRHPEWTDRKVGREVGLDNKTVASLRNDLVKSEEIPHFSERADPRTGRLSQPARRPRMPPSVFTDSRKTDRARAALSELGEAAPARQIDVRRAERIARESAAEQRRQVPVAPVTTVTDVTIYHGDFREVLAGIQPGSVDAIITDPPYPDEFVPLFGDLGAMALRILKPNGVLAAMTGGLRVPEWLAELGRDLDYRWLGAYIVEGPRSRVHAARVANGWKPILIFQHPGASDLPFILDDVFVSGGDDKRFHHWGQSESGMAALVERLSQPGALVVDPFLGGGTTAVVCKDLGRRFIGCDIDAAAVSTARERLR